MIKMDARLSGHDNREEAGPHTFPSARKIFPGVNGMSVSGCAPSGRSASLIAFMTQAGAPAVPASPAPLAPSSLSAVGDTQWPHSIAGIPPPHGPQESPP